jgi:hypothetical protein
MRFSESRDIILASVEFQLSRPLPKFVHKLVAHLVDAAPA